MPDLDSIPGLKRLWGETRGDRRVQLAIIDGPADLDHPCFAGASLRQARNYWLEDQEALASFVGHSTHITSVMLGQPGTEVEGLAPNCRGLVIPSAYDADSAMSELCLARAFDLAVEEGVQVIHCAWCLPNQSGQTWDVLQRSIDNALRQGIVVVAPAGNNHGICYCVPAILSGVLAVGALSDEGKPMDFTNFGGRYQAQGLMGPGENVLGAKPGGGTVRQKGTSVAAPILSGLCALLLSLQLKHGQPADGDRVRRALLSSALPCPDGDERCLMGVLNLSGAMDLLLRPEVPLPTPEPEHRSPPVWWVDRWVTMVQEEEADQASGKPPKGVEVQAAEEVQAADAQVSSSGSELQPPVVQALERVAESQAPGSESQDSSSSQLLEGQSACDGVNPQANKMIDGSFAQANKMIDISFAQAKPGLEGGVLASSAGLEASVGPAPAGEAGAQAGLQPSNLQQPWVYALGRLSYDFISETRRDSFAQRLSETLGRPANPEDPLQLLEYLKRHPSEAQDVLWILRMDELPVYAVEPGGPFASDVYGVLLSLFEEQLAGAERAVERISLPGRWSGRRVRLMSGNWLPVVQADWVRGLYGWNTSRLVELCLQSQPAVGSERDRELIRHGLRAFLDKVYYELRNLGRTSWERALNFAATNVFQAAQALAGALVLGMELETIEVEPSPFCRPNSDCWDVKLKFFDSRNLDRSRRVYRYTIDVSDILPVTLGDLKVWSTSR